MTENLSCKYFQNCGGCYYDNIKSKDYQNFKKIDLIKNLSQIFNINQLANLEFIWLDNYSRRRANFHVNNTNKLGFYAVKSHNIIEIDHCLIIDKEIIAIKKIIEKLIAKNFLNIVQNIIITKFDNCLDIIIETKIELNYQQNHLLVAFAKENNVNIATKINDFTTPLIIKNTPLIKINNYNIKLSYDIFLQANKFFTPKIIEILSSYIQSIANYKKLKIIDLYCGFGIYSYIISDFINKIESVEGVQLMINLMKKNISHYNLNHKISAFTQDLFFEPLSSSYLNKFDLALINPPRNGASPQIKEICRSNLTKIIYISCNPKTFIRDSKILLDFGFKNKKIIAIDQFVGSKYMELVSFYER